MKKRQLALGLSALVLLGGCSTSSGDAAEDPGDSGTETSAQPTEADQAVERLDAPDLDQAFGEAIRSDGAVLPEVQANGSGKVAVYLREFRDGEDEPPTDESWVATYLPEGMAGERPEDLGAVAVIKITGQAYPYTTNQDQVGDPIDQAIAFEVSLFNSESWSRVFTGHFFGQRRPVGSYTIDWAGLELPQAAEVIDFIEESVTALQAIPQSDNWRALAEAFDAFVAGHFDPSGEFEAKWGPHNHSPDPAVAYNGSGKLAGGFFDLATGRVYWTDAIVPEEYRAQSAEEVGAVLVVYKNPATEQFEVYYLPLAGEGQGCVPVTMIQANEDLDFAAVVTEVKGYAGSLVAG